MKKILPMFLCAMLFISCASKNAAIVDSTLAEAKTLQQVAKANGLAAHASADELITAAEAQNKDGQTEAAFLAADEAVLQFQLALQKQENKNIADSLQVATESLSNYRSVLEERKPKGRK
ncbi:MAG: hypothetical protein FWC15_07320 [Fibromonadales bacterium]|nr:hypothetical protein [Fibromonadales bacterium]